jgi:hypothetical protein
VAKATGSEVNTDPHSAELVFKDVFHEEARLVKQFFGFSSSQKPASP